jgi:hypothetical protein
MLTFDIVWFFKGKCYVWSFRSDREYDHMETSPEVHAVMTLLTEAGVPWQVYRLKDDSYCAFHTPDLETLFGDGAEWLKNRRLAVAAGVA